jgi:RNA polymerase sigma-70 factor (ECF subfamily)
MDRPGDVRELFDAEYAPLLRLATLITGDVAAAEDAVQEAFARALARWRRLRHYERPGAWLRLVTVRLAVRDKGRRARELSEPVPERGAVDDHGPDPELLAALRHVPADQRAALALFYFEALPTDEIAELLGVAPATVRSHLHRGRAALARRLSIPEVVNDAG